MARVFPQPYRLKWPLNASQLEDIDKMFEILFRITQTSTEDIASVSAQTGATGQQGTPGQDSEDFEPDWPGPIGSLNVANQVTGILNIGHGGTNSGTALSGSSIMVSDGTEIIQGAAGTTTTVLHGNAAGLPTYGSVVENDISLSAVATNNATTVRHGFLPVLSGNAAQFLDGNGNYSIPGAASIANSYSLTTFSGQTSVTVTHNFGTYPVVQVLTSTSVLVPLTITHNTLNDFTVTFAVSTSGSIIATVGSPQPQSVIVVSAATYTTLTTDRIIKVTTLGAVITLITAVGNTGREYVIDNASGGDITVDTTSSQTIDSELTQTLHTDNAMSVYSDGANWRIY